MEQDTQSINSKKLQTQSALGNIRNLPLIPKVMFEVTKLLHDPTISTSSLSRIIGKDQGLTAKVLSIANSPLYGLQRKVTSLEFAIIVLGFKEIADVITAISLADSIKVSSDKYFNQNEFWLHSMIVGTAAKGISQNLGFLDIGSDAFVAGVLHEIGVQILYKFFNQQYKEILEIVKTEKVLFLDAEREVLGLTHQEIGKFIADKWNLPDVLSNTLCYHHNPSGKEETKVLASIVHLADYMTQKFHNASFFWDDNIELSPEVLNTLQFKTEENLERFIFDYKDLFSQTIAVMRL